MKRENPGPRIETEIAGLCAYADRLDQVRPRRAEPASSDSDRTPAAGAAILVVDTPRGTRPFRVHFDPADSGAEEGSVHGDRIRAASLSASGSPTRRRPELRDQHG
jgi:hypothetical protein